MIEISNLWLNIQNTVILLLSTEFWGNVLIIWNFFLKFTFEDCLIRSNKCPVYIGHYHMIYLDLRFALTLLLLKSDLNPIIEE